MNDSASRLSFRGIEKRFGTDRVLNGLDLEVGDGESVVLIGPSGAGKTLLLKSLMGLVRIDAGTIALDGRDVSRLRGAEWRQFLGRVGMLFQWAALFDSLSVWQNVAFRLLQEGTMPREQARAIAVQKLAQVGMASEVADLLPAELSGGMQKRVGIARAIASEPEILILDEPTAGLDPIMSNVINDLITVNASELGATVLAVSSNIETVRRIADRVVMLQDGRIIWSGPPAELTRSDDPAVARFTHKWAIELGEIAA